MRKSKLLPLFFVIALLGSAITAATGSAAEPPFEHWWVGGARLAEETPTEVSASATQTFTLSAEIAGVNVKINCTAVNTTAGSKIRNPATFATKAGVFAGAIKFSGCTVEPAEQHCSVKGITVADPPGTITTASLTAEAKQVHLVKFSPIGEKFVELELSGCANAGLNKPYAVTGTAIGIANNTTGELEFTKTSGSELKLGGIPARFVGKAKVVTTAGSQKVEVKE